MKLRKKLIIFSILFLFGFGVFFGTFAKGGYLVKAANISFGEAYFEDLETPGGDTYNIDINLSYEDTTGNYYLKYDIYNFVYDILTEDYNINSGAIAWADSGNLLSIGESDVSISLYDIDSYQEEETIGVYITFYIELLEAANYVNCSIDIDGIYLGDNDSQNEIIISNNITFLSYELYDFIYGQGYYRGEQAGTSAGYQRGYSIGYQAGSEQGFNAGYDSGLSDGYDNGYNDGETAGYNDGLDIGYYNGYETGHYDGYTEGEAAGYSRGLDEGYEIGLDEGIQLTGYKEAYEAGIAKAENTATTWYKGIFDGFQRFFNIQLAGISIGAIVLIPLSITFAWFIIRQFRGGGGGD